MSSSTNDNTNTRVAPESEQDEVQTYNMMTGAENDEASRDVKKATFSDTDEGGYNTDTTAARQSSANTQSQSESEREPFWMSI